MAIKNIKTVRERVNNFDDILSELNTNIETLLPWAPSDKLSKKKVSQNAFAKIQAITEVYNEGFEFDWSNNSQPKYYLYFRKAAHGGGWVLDDVLDYYFSAYLSSGSYFKSREDAQDAYNKFKDIWDEFLPE